MPTLSKKRAERALAAGRRMRERGKDVAKANEHTLLASGTAFAMGFGERRGWEFPSPEGVDHKLLYAGVAFAASRLVRGARAKRLMGSLGDGLLAVYFYSAGKTGDFGVGDEGEENL